MIDPTRPEKRRRFFLERGLRKGTRRAGSALDRLVGTGVANRHAMVREIFGGLPVVLIGAHAAAHYAPERMTKDVDVLVEQQNLAEAERRLENSGYARHRDLLFPNAALGLYGSAWSRDADEIDVLSSPQPWVAESFRTVVRNEAGERVLPLAYLVLMKLDSARAIDQADLSRVLGRLDERQVDEIVTIVTRNYDDPSVSADIRQYALLGSWEYETDKPLSD